MDTKDVILELRTKKGLSQDELAEKLYVTRQAVSRWENGETIPNTETLKLLLSLIHIWITDAWNTAHHSGGECGSRSVYSHDIFRDSHYLRHRK